MLSAAFAYIPTSIFLYDDWIVYFEATRMMFSGDSPYNTYFYFGYFHNPPWLNLVLLPFAIFPFRFGAGMLSAATMIAILGLCHRYKLGIFKTTLVLGSPVVYYIVLHGQVDALVLAGIFLPIAFSPLVALAKPQTAIALGLKALEKVHFKKAVIISGGVFLLSLILVGLWPLDVISKPFPVEETHNFWRTLWPWQTLIGITLVFFWMEHKDERLLLIASPFFFPYAAFSSFLGLVLAIHTEIKNWQAVILFVLSWIFVWLPNLQLTLHL